MSYLIVDISNAKTLEEAVEEKENIDAIMNNVGVSSFNLILDITIEDFNKVLDINLRSVFITARTLAKYRESNPHLMLDISMMVSSKRIATFPCT